MIGYRASRCREDETKMDIQSPSQILAYEVVNLGQVWILEELLCKLNSCLDAKTKYQTKLFLNGVADGTIPVYDKNIDTTKYLLLFEKIVDALSRYLGFKVNYIARLHDLCSSFHSIVEEDAYHTGVEIMQEKSMVFENEWVDMLYAYAEKSLPIDANKLEYKLFFLDKTSNVIKTQKYKNFVDMVDFVCDLIDGFEHREENLQTLVISNGEDDAVVWKKPSYYE